MKRAWAVAWGQRVPYKLTRMLIIAFLQINLLSAMTVICLQEAHRKRMKRVLARELRLLVRQQIGGAPGERRLSVKQGSKFWKMAPIEIELGARKPPTYQRWARNPSNHTQELVAIFGHARLDKERVRVGTEAAGGLVANPTPGARQLCLDIEAAAAAEGAEGWRAGIGDDHKKCAQGETAEQFAQFNNTIPRGVGACSSEGGTSTPEDEPPCWWLCDLVGEEGGSTACGAKFISKKRYLPTPGRFTV
jgi:hypothetical protein